MNVAVIPKRATPAPIHGLPAEILIPIFVLSLGPRPCPLHLEGDYESALHTSTSYLGSLMHIVLSYPESKAFIKRARAYVARAGRTPLDIHIVGPNKRPLGTYKKGKVWALEDSDNPGESGGDSVDVMSPNATGGIKTNHSGLAPMRIRSLELAAHKVYPVQISALEYYLSRCALGILTQFTIRIENLRRSIHRLKNYSYVGDTPNTPAQNTGSRFASLTTLRLRGIYFPWLSRFYHGLVELWLEGNTYSISEQRLVGILRSSPRLRALHLALGITSAPGNGGNQHLGADVYLEDLETLDLHRMRDSDAVKILYRLSYGPKPLRLCLSNSCGWHKVFTNFRQGNVFEQSNWNLTELRVEQWSADDFPGFLTDFPRIQRLVVGTWEESGYIPTVKGCIHPSKSSLEWYSCRPRVKYGSFILDTLCVTHSSIDYDELQALVDFYSVRRLVIWGCSFPPEAQPAIDSRVFALCPVVEVLTKEDPNPFKWWV